MHFRLLLILLIATNIAMAKESCYHYGGIPVSLSGTVEIKTFYGAPNYGENPQTDSRETQAILFLEKPICVEANQSGEAAEQNQANVTLVPPDKENMIKYAGKHLAVKGVLFHAFNGHHHTPILMEIRQIENVEH